MSSLPTSSISVCLALTQAISRVTTTAEIYEAALDALELGVGVRRSSILLFDARQVMRFKAARGLSDTYRQVVEGHSPWTAATREAAPIIVPDVAAEPSLAPYLAAIQAEGIAAMAFIPLVSLGRVIGKFMLYYDQPHRPSAADLELAVLIAAQVAFAVERTRAEAHARRSEERLRDAMDAASMGTWDWDLTADSVVWSDNLERIHALPAGTFRGTFDEFESMIVEEDRPRMRAAVERAIANAEPLDVEYRSGASGEVRWFEGKGRVEYEDGRPVRMTGVCMDVTARKASEQARLSAAEESNRLKDEFLATLSHELRTPLNAIFGWVQMLHLDGLSPDRVRKAIDVIDRNARLQTQLIDDILDVSRIITGKLEVTCLPLLVPPLIDTAVSGVLPSAAAKRIRITKDVEASLPPLEGDAKRLQQVLGNLLSNAIKFTPEGGHVALRCATDGDSIVMSVRDTGVGIAPEFLPFVFDRFSQADSRSTRRHGGLGLGLAIARHLVEQHHGELWATSDGVGRGSTFSIRLPFSVSRRRPEGSTTAASTPAPYQPRLQGRRLLVVDDERDARELLSALLEQSGALVVSRESARGALEAAATLPVDLLIADIAMPDMDGYELVRRLRAAEVDVPAIAVSAYVRPEDRTRALKAGFQAYCPKPISADELLRTVSRVLTTANAGRHLQRIG